MKLKQLPEDFIVREIPGFDEDQGTYSIFKLKKRNYTTEKAVQLVCDKLHLNRKRLGYAGMKDRQAVTEQYVSIYKIKKEKVKNLKLKDVELNFVSFSNKPLSIGDLKGNSFELVIRELDKNCKIGANKKIKNFFDEQRFSNNNADIGKAILRKDFKKAVSLILDKEGDYETNVCAFIKANLNNFVGALRKVPHKILLLFVHSYQSYIFNETIKLLDDEKNIKIPLIGFGTEYKNKTVEKIITAILTRDGLSERDFIISAIPSLSCEGEEREMYVEPVDLKIDKLEKDELNKGKYKVKISFSLPKGAYATNVIKQIILG